MKLIKLATFCMALCSMLSSCFNTEWYEPNVESAKHKLGRLIIPKTNIQLPH